MRTVKAVAPVFGGINLEDISAPRCFEMEARLRRELDIPVFHDDQHGTAVVVLAGLLNALRVVGKRLEDVRIVVTGAGAAGAATARSAGRRRQPGGVLRPQRRPLSGARGPRRLQGEAGGRDQPRSDPGVGRRGPHGRGRLHRSFCSRRGSVNGVRSMADDAIVFAMANPTPEVEPEEIEESVAVVGTGRSDYPNQINNVLAFPGIFRGALDHMQPRSRLRWSWPPLTRWLRSSSRIIWRPIT